MWALAISFFRLAHFQGSVQAAACTGLSFLFVAIHRAANILQETGFWVMPTRRPL